MGCSLSCIRVMPLLSSQESKTIIRIVGLNGLVEEIHHPITAAEVTGKQTNQFFLFTQAQLLSAAATPLKLETPLEAGRVYFLLPSTLFRSNVSPVDLAPIVRKLTSIAQNTPSKSKSKSSNINININSRGGKSRSWKPILSTIRERSFNRRSESDLQADDDPKDCSFSKTIIST